MFLSSKRFRRGQHFLGVAGNLHFSPDAGDLAVLSDQEGRAVNAHIFSPVHALFDPHAIGLKGGLLFIRRERDGQVVLGLELVMFLDAVGRHAHQFDAGFVELRLETGKRDGLGRAAARIVLGVEEENDRLSLKLRQGDGGPGVPRQREIRRDIAF